MGEWLLVYAITLWDVIVDVVLPLYYKGDAVSLSLGRP